MSPPRGFCNPSSPCPMQPHDKITRTQAPSLFKTIDEKCLKYNAMQVDPIATAYMVEQFELFAKSEGASERFHVYNMTNGRLDHDTLVKTLAETIGKSIVRSIESHLKVTTDYLDNPGSKPNRCIQL